VLCWLNLVVGFHSSMKTLFFPTMWWGNVFMLIQCHLLLGLLLHSSCCQTLLPCTSYATWSEECCRFVCWLIDTLVGWLQFTSGKVKRRNERGWLRHSRSDTEITFCLLLIDQLNHIDWLYYHDELLSSFSLY